MNDLEDVAVQLKDAYGGEVFDLNMIRSLLMLFPDRLLHVGESLCIFLLLTDESFAALKAGFLDITKPEVIMPLFYECGANVHVISLVSKGVGNIKHLGDILKGKSISWFRPDMSKLVVFERR